MGCDKTGTMDERKLNRFQSLINGIPPEGSRAGGEIVRGEVVDGNDATNNSLSLAQRTSESILEARVLMGQLVRGDDESRKLLLEYFREGIEEKYLQNGNVLWPLRVALSGLSASPAPFELLWVLGKEESLRRIHKAITMLEE